MTLWVAVICLALLVGIPIMILLRVNLSTYFAIRNDLKEVEMFAGMIKLILWEPNEGLIVLKNKQVSEVINEEGGGRKYIYPIFGEELWARVSLAQHMLTWEDKNVLTGESLQLRIKAAIWWQIEDVNKYVFKISHLDTVSRYQKSALQHTTDKWLQTLTESTLRAMASEMNVASLILPNAGEQREINPRDLIPDAFVTRLRTTIAEKAEEYGIQIHRAEIQEVSLPEDVQQAIRDTWTAKLRPLQSESEARAKQIEIEALIQTLGRKDAADLQKLQAMQGSSFFGMSPLIGSMLTPDSGEAIPPQLPQNTFRQLPPPQAPSNPDNQPHLTELRRCEPFVRQLLNDLARFLFTTFNFTEGWMSQRVYEWTVQGQSRRKSVPMSISVYLCFHGKKLTSFTLDGPNSEEHIATTEELLKEALRKRYVP